MKKFLKNFSFMGAFMLVLSVILGVGGFTGVAFANGVATAVDGSGTIGDGGTGNPDNLKGIVVKHGYQGALETTDIRALRPEMIDDPVDQNLVKIRPSVNQLDTILRYAGAMKTNNFEYEWHSIGTRGLEDEIVEFNWTASATITGCSGSVKVTDFEKFDETDTFIIPSIFGNDGNPLVGYIYKKDFDANKFNFTIGEDQLVKGDTLTLASTPTAKTKIYCLGRAASELDVKTPAMSFIPTPTKGYCQIFMCQVAQSTFKKMQDEKIKFDMSEVEEQALYEYRRRLEGSFLFGHKSKYYNPTKREWVYATAGITTQISKKVYLDTEAADTNKELISVLKEIFTGNSGAGERVMLAGSEFVEKLSNINSVQKQVEAKNTEVIWGIKWNRIESNFGTLLLSHHDLLDEYGWSDKAIVIDPQYIKKWQLQNFEKKEYNGKDLAIMNGEFIVCSEVCGVAVYNPDAHCILNLGKRPEA